DRADVLVDPEDLLNDDHAAFGRARRIGAVSAQLVAVGGSQREMFTQLDLLSKFLAGWNEWRPISRRCANNCNPGRNAVLPHRRSIDECQMNENVPEINRLNLERGAADQCHGWPTSSPKVFEPCSNVLQSSLSSPRPLSASRLSSLPLPMQPRIVAAMVTTA